MIRELEIYNYCENRWDHYEKADKGYYPSKHDKKVLEDASTHFSITVEEAYQSHKLIAKTIADKEMKGLTEEEKVELFEKILRNNKETPWGMFDDEIILSDDEKYEIEKMKEIGLSIDQMIEEIEGKLHDSLLLSGDPAYSEESVEFYNNICEFLNNQKKAV